MLNEARGNGQNGKGSSKITRIRELSKSQKKKKNQLSYLVSPKASDARVTGTMLHFLFMCTVCFVIFLSYVKLLIYYFCIGRNLVRDLSLGMPYLSYVLFTWTCFTSSTCENSRTLNTTFWIIKCKLFNIFAESNTLTR